MRAFARWRLNTWTRRVQLYREERNKAVSGEDVDAWAVLLMRAWSKQIKWRDRVLA